MMRSASLKACLEGPHLWFDETANTLVKKDVENAQKFAKEARTKKDALDQINTAYQAVYCAVMALLHSINYKATNFRCVISVLEEYFIPKGILDKKDLEEVLHALKLEGTPEESMNRADTFVAKIETICSAGVAPAKAATA
ncbi:MAG: hypothetical protein C5B54_02075 [Acidobacteria bacterium]|nr:MAG: hypothetical protein C5B54_02075 [Acidobacteriota bacterium]